MKRVTATVVTFTCLIVTQKFIQEDLLFGQGVVEGEEVVKLVSAKRWAVLNCI